MRVSIFEQWKQDLDKNFTSMPDSILTILLMLVGFFAIFIAIIPKETILKSIVLSWLVLP